MRSDKLKSIINSIYLIPVILDHMESPTMLTSSILHENNIKVDDIDELKKIHHLLQYHRNVVSNSFIPDYKLLRTGLSEYFSQYLSTIFIELGLINTNYHMLDYCCGNGDYGVQFIRDNRGGTVTFLDRSIDMDSDIGKRTDQHLAGYYDCLNIDFEKHPMWYHGHKVYKNESIERSFDVVLLSEILHCKDEAGQKYLIQSSFDLLKPGGKLIINENNDGCMQYRINKLKGTNNKLLMPSDIHRLVNLSASFLKRKSITINYHNIIMYEKI